MKKYTKGFTLIELLVVIAIIGILSSVVLVSLNTARNKGKDARIAAVVQQLRAKIEADYGSNYNNSFTGVDTILATGDYKTLTDDAVAQSGSGSIIVRTGGAAATQADPVQRYAIYGRLVTDANKWFCIASDGTTNQATSSNAASGGC